MESVKGKKKRYNEIILWNMDGLHIQIPPEFKQVTRIRDAAGI